jgi:hypothetical protein
MRTKVRIGGAVLVAVLSLAAMGGGTASAAGHHHGGRGGMTISEAANGTTITLHAGQRLTVLLHSTFWTFAPANAPAVLAAKGKARYQSGGSGCPTFPGSGCGTVTQSYKALGAGTATVAAERTSCGEVLRCTEDQSHYRVTVRVVSP